MTWDHAHLDALTAAGQDIRPGSLGGLAAAREIHHGQFWTPKVVAQWIHRSLSAPLASWVGEHRRAILVDPTVGSGRLLQPWNPVTHQLAGCDVDDRCIRALEAACPKGDPVFVQGSWLDQLVVGKADVALLNPPFSLHWDSPRIHPTPCGAWGAHGRQSSVSSHLYLVHDACRWATVVVAILPMSAHEVLQSQGTALPILRCHLLPAATFRDEGTEVDTMIMVFGHGLQPDPTLRLLSESDVVKGREDWAGLRFATEGESAAFGVCDQDLAGEPATTLPVTLDATVHLRRCGRRIALGFACAVTEVLVRNAIYRVRLSELDAERPQTPRRAPGLVYDGEGHLDVQRLLAQPDPLQALDQLCGIIAQAGGTPVVDPAVVGYLRRAHRRLQRARQPYGLWHHRVASQSTVSGTVVRHLPLRAGFGAPVLAAGTPIMATRLETGWRIAAGTQVADLTVDQVDTHCSLQAAAPSWQQVHPSRSQACVQAHEDIARRSRAMEIDRILSWTDYQWEDFLEVRASARSGIIAWEMGLGKARLALALCLAGGRRNLIVVEAHLIDEMLKEVVACGLPPEMVRVIAAAQDLKDLRRINIIAYSRLRMPVDPTRSRRTYGKALGRAIHTLVCDEVHVLRNQETAQTQAVRAIRARRRYGLSGTPVANYPRDVLQLLIWVGGDGTALQPYGMHHAHCSPESWSSLDRVPRSTALFMDRFITMEWVTNEFAEDLSSGAKREVPRLRNPEQFQQMVAPFIKRRVADEPDVARYLSIPRPERVEKVIPWDPAHLEHYLEVSAEFAQWYRQIHRDEGQQVNLVALLARIAAVQAAANCPDHPVGEIGRPFHDLTSKHRRAADRIEKLVSAGHRAILFAHRPVTVERLGSLLQARGIEAMAYHGQIPVARRNRELYSRFVNGSLPVLVATFGSCQTGLNLHAADRVLFYERCWDPKTERQAAARVLRPQQKRPVVIEYLHLQGSIDTYQAQLVGQKWAAASAGLDGQEQPDDDFEHLDTLLGRFVEELARLQGLDPRDLREHLARSA